MSQLVAYYEMNPVGFKRKPLDIRQLPIDDHRNLMSTDDAPIRTGKVYVKETLAGSTFHVPFGDYDLWELQHRYDEALRVMTELGAAEIVCKTYREIKNEKSFLFRLRHSAGSGSGEVKVVRNEDSNFDYEQSGTGGVPKDPRPIAWSIPGLEAAVNNVLNNGVSRIAISISSSSQHSIKGDLGVKLVAAGFSLGGSSENSGNTILQIAATFPKPE